MTERVRIDRVEIRLRGGDARSARALATALGPALAPVLAGRSGRIERVHATVGARRVTAPEVARAVGDAIDRNAAP